MTEAKEGEFTLTYNKDGKARPVALTNEQHQMLQAFIQGFGKVTVVKDLIAEYKKEKS